MGNFDRLQLTFTNLKTLPVSSTHCVLLSIAVSIFIFYRGEWRMNSGFYIYVGNTNFRISHSGAHCLNCLSNRHAIATIATCAEQLIYWDFLCNLQCFKARACVITCRSVMPFANVVLNVTTWMWLDMSSILLEEWVAFGNTSNYSIERSPPGSWNSDMN